jgi:hypothetical protein
MSGAKLFNFVRQESTGNFKEVVPLATDSNISDISNILFNDAYQPLLNEFVNNLINRIGLTIIRNKSYDNPLALLKKGSTPLGTDIQDIYTNPSEAEQYQLSNEEMAKLLTITDPDTKVAYYRRNRKDMYTKTIAREALQGAFVSWDRFENFISSITQSLYSGAYIDEFKYTKGLVAGAYENNKAIVQTVTAVTTDATAKAFVKKVRNLYKSMRFPSTAYNAYSLNTGDNKPVTTWTTPERVVFLVRADVMTEVDVEVLASAFNMDKADFLGRVIEVDKFDDNNKVLGVICDEAFFQIYDNIFRFDEFYNARTMSWNEFLHVWETFAICPFANAVILATEAPSVDATDIDASKSSVSVKAGATVSVPLTVTPPNATSAITASSSAEGKATVTISGRNAVIAGVEAGSATITVTCNGHTDTISVTVTSASE